MISDTITIRVLGPEQAGVLGNVAEGVFDNAIDMDQAQRFLGSATHHMAVALAKRQVVGMASGNVLFHPDKRPQFFVNEVGVGDGWLRRGIAERLMQELLRIAAREECDYVWLGTEEENAPARALYRKLGGKETEGLVVYEWQDDPAPQAAPAEKA